MNHLPRLSLLPLALAAALASTPSMAGTDQNTLSVSAVVTSSCTLLAGSISFGTYTNGQTGDLNGLGQIDLQTCTAGRLSFDADGGSSGAVNARTMGAGDSKLRYQLFTDQARTQVWGGSSPMLLSNTKPGSIGVPIFGRIFGGQTVAAGTYSDTIRVTLTF